MCEKSASLDETLDLDINDPGLKEWARYALNVTPLRRDLPLYKELTTIRDESLTQFQKLSRDYIDVKRQLHEQKLIILRNRILLAPIRTVPDDILGRIFIFTGAGWARHLRKCSGLRSFGAQVLPFEADDTFTFKSIMQVSKVWYRVANSTPALWSSLLLCHACRPVEKWKPTQHWIERTAHLPMTIFLNTGYIKRPSFKKVLDSIPILQCIQIIGSGFYPSFLREQTPHRMTIKTLDLSIENTSEGNDQKDSSLAFPQLENLRIKGLVRFDRMALPAFISPLRKLVLDGMTLDSTDLRHQLELIPSLVSLTFNLIDIRDRASFADDDPETDVMPNLIYLSISRCMETSVPSFFRWLQRNTSHVQTFRLNAGSQQTVDTRGTDYIVKCWGGDPLSMASVPNFIYRADLDPGSNEFSKWMHLEKLQTLKLALRNFDSAIKYNATTILLALCQGSDITPLPSLLKLILEGMSFELSALLGLSWARSYSPHGALSVTNSSTISKCDITLKGCDYVIEKLTRPIPDIQCASWSELSTHFKDLNT